MMKMMINNQIEFIKLQMKILKIIKVNKNFCQIILKIKILKEIQSSFNLKNLIYISKKFQQVVKLCNQFQ